MATDLHINTENTNQKIIHINSIDNKNESLWMQYQQQKATNKMLFPTEGAEALQVTELELVLASPYSQYIGSRCKEVLEQLDQFGKVESIVRNKFAVHEKRGLYHNIEFGNNTAIALNVGGLDLRFFIKHWAHMLAIKDTSKEEASYSLQFFDESGNAINKVFLRDDSEANVQRWQRLVDEERQKVTENEILLEISDTAEPKPWVYQALDAKKLTKLQTGWTKLKDIHQFHMLLHGLKVDRASSYHQAPENMAQQLTVDAIDAMLQAVKDKQCSLMTFVGNTGVVQIQTGQVHNIKMMGDWINILDKAETDFTLHLNLKALKQIWCIKRPTKDGIVTSVEAFDDYGNSIVTFFGERMEGEPERQDWREVTDMLLEYAVT